MSKKPKISLRQNFHTLWALKTDHMTHIELKEASKQDGRSTSNAKICSKTPNFKQSIQANNDKEGSQSLSEKLKTGKKVAAATEPLVAGKFNPMWHGPYVVKRVLEKGVYDIVDYEGTALAEPRNGLYLKKYYA